MASTNNPVSPKVTAGASWAAVASLVLTVLTAITPEMLAFLGPWAALAYGVVVGASAALGGYLKSDPVRAVGVAVLDVKDHMVAQPAALPAAPEAPHAVAPVVIAEDIDAPRVDGPRHAAPAQGDQPEA
ncbi:membrane protein [Arthrobacter phage MaGuCo]|uniref:Membrane protein n=1 Tax=Arthrobacter phage MaGuCo TaxID=3038363 RepID=A0AAF0GH35_9CAUD|nr:membrane protein [Arthrobacter phage MaGuCo]